MTPAARETRTSLRVVHVSTDVSRGGASAAMRRLHEGLLHRGIESTVMTLAAPEPASNVEIVTSPRIEAQRHLLDFINAFIYDERTPISNSFFSPDVAVSAELEKLPALQSADVVHLHWVAGFLSGQSLRNFAALGKPIFWTLHDLRPLSGGCHFPAGCGKFTTRCVECPQLKTDPLRMTERGQEALRLAAAALKIHYVAPSSWLEHCAQTSTIAASRSVSRVPYGLDAQQFSPMDKKAARGLAGLRSEAFYLLLGAQNFEETRKGAAPAQEILRRLAARPALQSKIRAGAIRLACFGRASDKLKVPGWQVDRLGYLQNQDQMRAAYAGCDLLLFTSQEDNLPNVILEAMACGLPAAGFSVGGVPDLMADGENGLLLDPHDLAGAAAKIAETVEHPDQLAVWSANARRKIVEGFTLDHQAAAMIALYRKVLADGTHPEVGPLAVEPDATFLEFESVVQLAVAHAQEKTESLKGRFDLLKRYLKKCRRAPWKLYGKRPSI